jgi:hypothetical protein
MIDIQAEQIRIEALAKETRKGVIVEPSDSSVVDLLKDEVGACVESVLAVVERKKTYSKHTEKEQYSGSHCG